MTSQEKQLEQLIHKRAEALLAVRLTVRDDLLVTEQAQDFGVDFVVQITQKNKPTGRLFGIELKARASASQNAKISLSKKVLASYKDSPYPICLCFFFMGDDRGFYRWLFEPTVEPNGFPRLRPAFDTEQNQSNGEMASLDIADFADFDNDGLSDIVAKVNQWYDARASRK